MSRRGRGGGDDDGFRLLPRRWAGKSTGNPSDPEQETPQTDETTEASTPAAETTSTHSAGGARLLPKRFGKRSKAAASGTAAAGTASSKPVSDKASVYARPSYARTDTESAQAAQTYREGGTDEPSAEGSTVAASSGGSSGLLIGGLLVGGLGVIVVGAFAGYYLFTHLIVGLTIRDVPGSVVFPPEFQAIAKVTNNLDIVMDGVIEAQVPFKQTLNLPLKGRYEADVEIDAPVPVKFDVVYDGTIPVDTFADIVARADFNFQDVKTYRELEIKARLPMKMALPVKLTAPVDTTIDFKYKGPLVMGLDQTIQAPVDTTLNTRLVVKQQVNTPVTADIPLTVHVTDKPVKVILSEADLQLDISTLRLEVADDNDQPERTESPWGPPYVEAADGSDAQAAAQEAAAAVDTPAKPEAGATQEPDAGSEVDLSPEAGVIVAE